MGILLLRETVSTHQACTPSEAIRDGEAAGQVWPESAAFPDIEAPLAAAASRSVGGSNGTDRTAARRARTEMNHDRIHAQEPAHHRDRWSVGTVASVTERDGHCVVTVTPEEGGTVELVVTFAVRDLFVSRLDIDEGESPVGERVWYRKRGG